MDEKQSHGGGIDLESRAVQTNHYVNLYFAHFHTHWPILHRATFSIPDEPPLLLQAVIAIGLWVSDKSSARQAAVDLHRKIGVWIREQRVCLTLPFLSQIVLTDQVQWEKPLSQKDDSEDGPVSKCPIATYQAILLYLIFSLIQSGCAYLLDFSLPLPSPDLEVLSALVEVCIRNKIFHYPNMIERYEGINSMACIWVGIEEICRLGLALYKVSRLCKNRNSNGGLGRLLQLSDLHFPVPDSQHIWDAQSNLEFSRALRIDRGRGRTDAFAKKNWISISAKGLESGSERWWM